MTGYDTEPRSYAEREEEDARKWDDATEKAEAKKQDEVKNPAWIDEIECNHITNCHYPFCSCK